MMKDFFTYENLCPIVEQINGERDGVALEITYGAIYKLAPVLNTMVKDACMRAEFEAWASTEWPNSRPPEAAWLGWKGAREGN